MKAHLQKLQPFLVATAVFAAAGLLYYLLITSTELFTSAQQGPYQRRPKTLGGLGQLVVFVLVLAVFFAELAAANNLGGSICRSIDTPANETRASNQATAVACILACKAIPFSAAHFLLPAPDRIWLVPLSYQRDIVGVSYIYAALFLLYVVKAANKDFRWS